MWGRVDSGGLIKGSVFRREGWKKWLTGWVGELRGRLEGAEVVNKHHEI